MGVAVKKGALVDQGDWGKIKRIKILDIEKMLKGAG
jgi:hypothetical protein